MTSLALRTSALLLSLFGVVPLAAAAVRVTTSESDTFPEETDGPQYFTIVDPLDGAVIEGAPDANIQVIIEYENFDGAAIGLDDFHEVDGEWVHTPLGMCTAAPSPCTLDITLTPGSHGLTAQGEGPGGGLEVSNLVRIDVIDSTAEATDTDTSGAASETGTAPTSSASDGTATGGADTDATGDSSTSEASASGGDSAEGDKGCACTTTGATGPDVVGLALAALLIPWRRRQRR